MLLLPLGVPQPSFINVQSPGQTVIEVGAGRDYSSINAAIAAAPKSSPVVILLHSDLAMNAPLYMPEGRDPSNFLAVVGVRSANGDRPKLSTSSTPVIRTRNRTNGIILQGLHLNDSSRMGSLFLGGEGERFELYDMVFNGTVIVQPMEGKKLSNVMLACNYLVDSNYHGIYAKHVNGLTLVGNVIDNNRYDNRDALTHGAYIQVTCRDLAVVGNLFSRSSSHGLQARCGGIVESNIFYRNAVGMSFGVVIGGAAGDRDPNGVNGRVSGNVFFECDDIRSTLPRGMALELGNTGDTGTDVYSNIMIEAVGGDPQCIALSGDNAFPMRKTKIYDNFSINGGRILIRDGEGFFGVNVVGNVISNPHSDRPVVQVRPDIGSPLQGILFDANRYTQPSSGLPFQIGRARVGEAAWADATRNTAFKLVDSPSGWTGPELITYLNALRSSSMENGTAEERFRFITRTAMDVYLTVASQYVPGDGSSDPLPVPSPDPTPGPTPDPTPDPLPEPTYPYILITDSEGDPHNSDIVFLEAVLGAPLTESHEFQVHNTGTAAAAVSFEAQVGDLSDFIIGADNGTIEPGKFMRIPVTFKPLSAGLKQVSLLMKTDAQNSTSATFRARGSAVAPVTPEPPVDIAELAKQVRALLDDELKQVNTDIGRAMGIAEANTNTTARIQKILDYHRLTVTSP